MHSDVGGWESDAPLIVLESNNGTSLHLEGRKWFSMLLRLIPAVGVSDARPEKLLLKPTHTYLRGGEGLKTRNRKIGVSDRTRD